MSLQTVMTVGVWNFERPPMAYMRGEGWWGGPHRDTRAIAFTIVAF